MNEETKKTIGEAADKFAFQVPYNGTSDFYNNDRHEGFIAGATWAITTFNADEQLTEPGQPVPAGEWIDRDIPPKKDGHYEVAVYDSEHDECLNEFSGFIDGQWLCEPPYKKTRNRVTHWKSKTPLPTLSQAG